MLALPWERVQRGSVLKIILQGRISDQLSNPDFTTLPQISDAFLKAAYDSRISALYLSIYALDYSWAILEELRSEILNFKKSGKLVVAHLPLIITEKEYYLSCVCDEIYAAPGVQCSFSFEINPYKHSKDSSGRHQNIIELIEMQDFRKGKYKRAVDECTDYHREALKSLRDSIYSDWLDKVRKGIENFVNKGVFEVGKLRDDGFVSELLSTDEDVINMLKERIKVKSLPLVLYEKYCQIKKSSVGIPRGKEQIAVIRASGSISQVLNPPFTPVNGIFAERIIEQIHRVKDSDRFKAVIIRIESLGGCALASSLILREIQLIEILVVISVVDAMSGGYSIAMGGQTIISGNLSLIGSIGITFDIPNYEKVYEKFGLTANIISRGKFAELHRANHRRLKPHEARLIDKITQNGYNLFRDTAADCRGMTVDKMEEIAQGRCWTGKEAVSHGLVDAIGGLSRAIAIAKFKSNISQDTPVTIVEIGSH
jgi:protease-4